MKLNEITTTSPVTESDETNEQFVKYARTSEECFRLCNQLDNLLNEHYIKAKQQANDPFAHFGGRDIDNIKQQLQQVIKLVSTSIKSM